MKKLNISSFDFENMKDVPLHEELQAYVEPFPQLGGEMLRHPLVYAVPYVSQFSELYNRQFELKQQGVADALSEKKWGTVIALHERPHRLHALIMCLQRGVMHKEYWRLLGEVWVDTEAPWVNLETWLQLFTASIPQREHLMSSEERNDLASLPDILTAYRGVSSQHAYGASWTLDYERAKRFANRYGGAGGAILCGAVKKKDVLAHFTRRGEAELVVAPDRVHSVREVKS